MTELTEDGDIEFDTDIPGVDPLVMQAYESIEAQTGGPAVSDIEEVADEGEDEPEQVAASEEDGDETAEELDVDWRARAEEAERAAARAEYSAKQARLQAKEQRERIESRIEALVAAQQKATEPPPEPEPDFDSDPKGWIERQNESVLRAVDEVRQQVTPREPTPEEQQYQQLQQYQQTTSAYEQQFAASTPDYYEAVSHAQKALADQQRSIYGDQPLIDPQTNQPILDGEGNVVPRYLWEANRAEAAMVTNWMQQGVNPAEAYYNAAKSTYGWAAPEGGEEGEAEAAPRRTAASHVREGLAKNRSLGRSSGAAKRGKANEMTAEEFARMNASHDPEDQAWVAGIWNHSSGQLASQILKDGRATIPSDVKPLRL